MGRNGPKNHFRTNFGWLDPKKVDFWLFLTPQNHKIQLLRGQTHTGWPQNNKVYIIMGRGTLSHHFKTKVMGVGRNGGFLDPLSRFVTPPGALFPRNFFQAV